METRWPYELALDRTLLSRVYGAEDVAIVTYYSSRLRSMMSESAWTELAGSLVYHLAVEVLIDESISALFRLRQACEGFVGMSLSQSWRDAAFRCLARSSIPVSAELFDGLLTNFGVDPLGSVATWPCVCCASCDSARRMCECSSSVDLALKSMNSVGLERILNVRSDASPSSIHSLIPLFSLSSRPSVESRALTLSVLTHVFPESTCPEFYAAARLVAVLQDAREGLLGQLPVEKVGAYGRTCKGTLRELVWLEGGGTGTPVLFLVSGIPASVGGRDAIFQFLIDLGASAGGMDKEGRVLLEHALHCQPEFWRAQTKADSPADILGKIDKFPESISSKFFWECSHIQTTAGCSCSLCIIWQRSAHRSLLHLWLNRVTKGEWDSSILPSFKLLEETNADTCMQLIKGIQVLGSSLTLLRSRDFFGNTPLHVATEASVISALVKASPQLVLARNNGEETPLDMAIREGNISKVRILMEEGGGAMSPVGIEWLCALNNRDVNRVVEEGMKNVRSRGFAWAVEVERILADMKQLELHHSNSLNQLQTKHSQELSGKANELNLKLSKAEQLRSVDVGILEGDLANLRSKLAKTEALLNETVREKRELESEKTETEKRVKRMEKNKSKLEQERKEFETETESRECSLCMAHSWDTALVCGHCYCLSCVQNLCKVSCPTCAKKTGGKFTKLFIFKK